MKGTRLCVAILSPPGQAKKTGRTLEGATWQPIYGPALASAPQRYQKIKAGSPMPEVYAKFMTRETADADNAAITWTLVRAD